MEQNTKKKHPNWGGRRPGAGAPKGNLNGLKHGRYSRYQRALIDALLQVPETREIMLAMARRRRAQNRLAERGAAALMSELLRRTGQVALHGDDHLEDIQEFLTSIRMAEAELEKILKKQSSADARKQSQSSRRKRGSPNPRALPDSRDPAR